MSTKIGPLFGASYVEQQTYNTDHVRVREPKRLRPSSEDVYFCLFYKYLSMIPDVFRSILTKQSAPYSPNATVVSVPYCHSCC